MLTGSVATVGGTSGNGWNKFVPEPPLGGQPITSWNELTWPTEYPLAHHEMSILLPHFLNEGRGKLDTYFTRVYNPVWTNPDGFSWMEALLDETKVGCHVALTPTWSETSWYADYVLPMGLGSERHDLASFETHSGRWLGFRQPVMRRYAELQGEEVGPDRRTFEFNGRINGGEVWEENEFWVDLSWRIDPDGSLGIRQHFESIDRPGTPIGVDEYYGRIFADAGARARRRRRSSGRHPARVHARPGRVRGARRRVRAVRAADRSGGGRGLHPPRRRGVRQARHVGRVGRRTRHARPRSRLAKLGDGTPAVEIDGELKAGFPTPSMKLELFSTTIEEWGWPEHATPGWIPSHVHWEDLDLAGNERILMPTFRIPTLIHTRSGNSKWLNEISHRHPLWIHPSDAEALGIEESGLVRISTRIGHFVIVAWRTEGIRPGVVAASHHMGRWRVRGRQARSWGAGKARIAHDGIATGGSPREHGMRGLGVGRPRHAAHLVARHRRPPEPRVRRPARPDLGHALLAPAGAGRTGPAGRSVRRRRGRHRQVARGLPGVAGARPARRRARRAAPPAVVRTPAQARGRGVPALRVTVPCALWSVALVAAGRERRTHG